MNRCSRVKNNNRIVSHILRVCIGGVFVASAVLKYMSIDIFDLYIYEHNLFNLAISSTLTRLLIAAELVLGIFLITNIYIRFTRMLTYVFLIGFTIYLFLQPYLFDVQLENCFCFGDKIILNHTQSIIKNILLMLLLFFVNVNFYNHKKYELLVAVAITILSTVGFLVIDAPDYLYKKIHNSEVRINKELYDKTLKENEKFESFSEDKLIIAMYSHQCKYCGNSAMKIDKVMKRNHIPADKFKCVFWDTADSTEIYDFYTSHTITPLEYTKFSIDYFLEITHGQMPVILFSDNGNIVKSVHYVGLTEKDIVGFLTKK